MKRILFPLVVSILFTTSCKADSKVRYIYLSAKYRLQNVGFSESAKIASEPPYFNQLTDLTPCDDVFDKDNCFVTFRVEIINKKPHGYGSLDLAFQDVSIEKKHYDFDYVVLYDKVYGGEPIQINNTKPDILGKQRVRGNYWWYRAEVFLPEIDNKRIITEFHVIEKYDEPGEFDERYN